MGLPSPYYGTSLLWESESDRAARMRSNMQILWQQEWSGAAYVDMSQRSDEALRGEMWQDHHIFDPHKKEYRL